MAANSGKRNTKSKRGIASKKSIASKKNIENDKNAKDTSFMKDEIILLSILAVSVLLLLSNFKVGGAVGNAVNAVMFGLFGMMGYAVPVILFVGAAFTISNKNNAVAWIKTIAGAFLFFLFCTLLQVIFGKPGAGILDYYKISAAEKTGGGFFGGIISSFFLKAFGTVGTYVVTIVLMIICFVLITERSFFKGVKKGSSKVYETAKVDAVRRREKAAARKSEQNAIKKEKRINKKVSGVAVNTKILSEQESEDELHEITISGEPFAAVSFEEDLKEEFQPEELEAFENQGEFAEEPAAVFEEPLVQEEAPPEIKRKPKLVKENKKTETKLQEYKFPPITLLKSGTKNAKSNAGNQLKETAKKLQQTLANFGVQVTITNVSCGPAVTRYELQPEQGVKVSKIVNLADDIKLNLAAADIRIEAPIPGKAAVGIEVPNKESSAVMLRDLLEAEEFRMHASKLAFAVGKDIGGQNVVTDIAKMPHLLIAGATGSGKSVCINTIIMSILYKADPEEVKLIMIDPKVVELSVYNGIPHLLIPVVTDPKKASGALNWAVMEMTDRYKKFADLNVRDLKGYNEKVETVEHLDGENKPEKMPQIVIIVDELADLMMVAPGEVEDAICRLAQLARAAGIHLIIATQRPSVNVITGLIKANMPSRIAFSVSSGVDSRTIIDMNGAEKLLGKGDMLFYPSGYQKPVRVQCAFVSDKEVSDVVDFLSQNHVVQYNQEIEMQVSTAPAASSEGGSTSDRDAYFADAGKFIIEKDKASIGMLQRVFKIGFNRAARIMDQLADAGVVGEEEGTKPRKVLMTLEDFEECLKNG